MEGSRKGSKRPRNGTERPRKGRGKALKGRGKALKDHGQGTSRLAPYATSNSTQAGCPLAAAVWSCTGETTNTEPAQQAVLCSCSNMRTIVQRDGPNHLELWLRTPRLKQAGTRNEAHGR